jgi:hypothetical protein
VRPYEACKHGKGAEILQVVEDKKINNLQNDKLGVRTLPLSF